jgi:deoxycytidine triphosphate deaminase
MSLWRLRSKCGTRFLYSFYSTPLSWILEQNMKYIQIKVITKLPNSEQSYKGKVKTHNYINRQNQSTTEKL